MFTAAAVLPGAVVQVEITERSRFADGQAFGTTGTYEHLKGRVHFAVDPRHPANRGIADIASAERDADGQVRFSADLHVLQPADLAKGNRTILFDVVNRGKRTILSTFHRGQGSDGPDRIGDALLLKAGYTLVWLGWQHDVPLASDVMRVHVPVAKGTGGLVRGEYTPDKAVELLPLGDAGHVPYSVAGEDGITLSVRDAIHGTRITVPRSEWTLENGTHIRLRSPAVPGRIYEFIYKSAEPAVAGLGLAGIRDFISHYKRETKAAHAIGFGSSQSAMVLRALLYEGMNADEKGKKVFDGIFAHVAGGRRSSFHRFAQPSRTAGPLRNASHSRTEQFPFSDIEQLDPVTGVRDGVLKRAATAKVVPKIFYTNSAYEYWGSAASLLHTTPDGQREVELPQTTRLYVFAGGQHGPAAFPPREGRGQHLPSFNDYRYALRPLLERLQAWVASDREPPASMYPRVKDKTLVPLEAYRFPPGVRIPGAIHVPRALEAGAAEPPRLRGAYAPRVPQSDADGNDLAGVRMPEVQCALGAFTGWNLRTPAIGAPDTLLTNTGSYIPFPRIPERFAAEEAYASCVEVAASRLRSDGFLLASDVPAVLEAARRHWRWRTESLATSLAK